MFGIFKKKTRPELPEVPGFLVEAAQAGGAFANFNRVDEGKIATLLEEYPKLSPQYLAFISEIGLGQMANGLFYHLPEPISSMDGHDSVKIGAGDAARALFNRPRRRPAPPNGVIIADPFASWRYGFHPDRGNIVHCLELTDGSFEPLNQDFFSFLERELDPEI